MGELSCTGLAKSFGETVVLSDVDLDMAWARANARHVQQWATSQADRITTRISKTANYQGFDNADKEQRILTDVTGWLARTRSAVG